VPFHFIPRYSLRLTEEYVREQARMQQVRDETIPSREDMRAILDLVLREGKLSLYATLRLMWHLGLRRSEAVCIRRDSFSRRADGKWVFARYGKAERMTGRVKFYAIPDTIAADVRRAFEKVEGWEVPECPLLYLEQMVHTRFTQSPRGVVFQRMKPQELTFLIQEYSKLAIERKIGSHDIRRGRATQMMKDGRPIEMICRNLNMSREVLLRHYDRSKPSLADDILTSSDFEIDYAANSIESKAPGAVPAPALKAWGEHRLAEPGDQEVERDRRVGSWRL